MSKRGGTHGVEAELRADAEAAGDLPLQSTTKRFYYEARKLLVFVHPDAVDKEKLVVEKSWRAKPSYMGEPINGSDALAML